VDPRISVVVPAFNEARFLPKLLETIEAARKAYRFDRSLVEVVVADNGSTDGTRSIAEAQGCRVVRAAPRVIAAVRNAGARAARGNVLAFVDADTRIHEQTFNAIEDYFRDGDAVAGVCGAVPERSSLPIALGWSLVGAMTALTGFGLPLSFADCMPTGVVCCRRDDWRRVGGYPEDWRFAEDAVFLLDLVRLGRREGRPWGWIHGAPATVSTRKFDEHGEWHFVTMPLKLVMLALRSGGLSAWAKRYWYGRQRSTHAG